MPEQRQSLAAEPGKLPSEMYLLKCLAALLVAVLVSGGNALPLNNCTASYQAALNEALTIKEQCQGAAFYDCCQVRTPLKLMYDPCRN